MHHDYTIVCQRIHTSSNPSAQIKNLKRLFVELRKKRNFTIDFEEYQLSFDNHTQPIFSISIAI